MKINFLMVGECNGLDRNVVVVSGSFEQEGTGDDEAIQMLLRKELDEKLGSHNIFCIFWKKVHVQKVPSSKKQ